MRAETIGCLPVVRKNAGTDGTDLGANIDGINSQTAGVLNGVASASQVTVLSPPRSVRIVPQ